MLVLWIPRLLRNPNSAAKKNGTMLRHPDNFPHKFYSSSPMASAVNTMVNIQNTYVCIAPENKSKYACKNAGQTNVSTFGNKPYTNPNITEPDKILPNKRNDNEIGVANSPIRLIGKKKKIGSNNPLIFPIF